MHYIILKDNVVVGTTDTEPCADDLGTRGEVFVVAETVVATGYTYSDGVFSAPTVTEDQKLQAIRSTRDGLLNSTAYIFQRQLTGSDSQKLSEEDYAKWVVYWQELRDFPEKCNVDSPVWPTKPTV